jgi:hypothetical protein
MTSHVGSSPRWLPVFAWGWLAVAVVVAASGRLAAIPFPGPQLVLVGLAALVLFLGTRVGSVRAWVEHVPLRVLVGVHVVRLVGFAFLALSGRGLLSPVFAERAGWGDIVTALGAAALVLSGDPRTPRHRALYFIWNTFGLLDFVNVVGTAAWIGMRGIEPGLAPLVRLPFSLLPTFFVPILMASHVFVYRGLLAMKRESHAS